MPEYTLKWNGDSIKRRTDKLVLSELKSGAKLIESDMKSFARRHRHTGNLEKGIVTEKARYGIGYLVKSKMPHTHLIEFGTAQDRKRQPSRRKALRFITESGEIIFAKWVDPMPKMPFIRPALHRHEKEIYQKVKVLIS